MLAYVKSCYLYIYINKKKYSLLHRTDRPTYLDWIHQKRVPTYRGYVVNPHPETPQGQPATKPETLLQSIVARKINMIQPSSITTSSIWCFQRISDGKNVILWCCRHITAIAPLRPSANRPLTRYIKLRVAHAPGMPGMLPPPPTSNEAAS